MIPWWVFVCAGLVALCGVVSVVIHVERQQLEQESDDAESDFSQGA